VILPFTPEEIAVNITQCWCTSAGVVLDVGEDPTLGWKNTDPDARGMEPAE
jgi:hypothetical protein